MKVYEYQRSRSFIDLSPSHSDLIFSNFFSSITAKPIEAKFHMKQRCVQNGLGHLTKMAAMPIYGKNLWKPSSLERKGRWRWNLARSIWCSSNTIFVQMMIHPGMTLTYFMARSNLVPYAFVWEKVKTMDFSETIAVFMTSVFVDEVN